MIVITVATDKKGYYNILTDCCTKLGLKFETLGMNQEWTGFTMKLDLLKEYLSKFSIYEIILFIDDYYLIISEV